jgi:hypothetical protein
VKLAHQCGEFWSAEHGAFFCPGCDAVKQHRDDLMTLIDAVQCLVNRAMPPDRSDFEFLHHWAHWMETGESPEPSLAKALREWAEDIASTFRSWPPHHVSQDIARRLEDIVRRYSDD